MGSGKNEVDTRNYDTENCSTICQPEKKQPNAKKQNCTQDQIDHVPDSQRITDLWSYVIITSSFMVTVLTLGFKTSLGVFYVEWEHYFDVTKTEVSRVTSMSPMVIGITSLFATSISHAIGPRPTVILGGIFATVGIFASSFSQNIYHLMITIGIVSASGMGFAFAPALTVLGHYFEKRYTVAVGIAIAGFSFGDLIFPLILQPMIDSYGWKGALFIMSAIELNLIACGCTMKIPKKETDSSEYDHSIQMNNSSYDKCENVEATSVSNDSHVADYLQVTHDQSCIFHAIINEGFENETNLDRYSLSKQNSVYEEQPHVHIKEDKKHIKKETKRPKLYKQTSQIIEDMTLQNYSKNRFLRPLFYPSFLVMLVVMLLHGIGWYAVIANLVPYASYYGISDLRAAELLTFIGLGSLTGCLTQGWLIDTNLVSGEIAKIVSLTTLTAITFAFPYEHESYAVLVSLCVAYGLAAGVSLPLFFALVRHLLPPQDVSAGVSLMIFGEMLGDTIGGLLAGFFNETFGNYTASFFLAGGTIAAATILLLLLSFLKRYQRTRKVTSGGQETGEYGIREEDIENCADNH